MEFAPGIEAVLWADEPRVSSARDNDVVVVPIPALVVLLKRKETEKGAPLTRREVESLRDRARCMKLPRSVARALDAQRGYSDVDFTNCWEAWSARH